MIKYIENGVNTFKDRFWPYFAELSTVLIENRLSMRLNYLTISIRLTKIKLKFSIILYILKRSYS